MLCSALLGSDDVSCDSEVRPLTGHRLKGGSPDRISASDLIPTVAASRTSLPSSSVPLPSRSRDHSSRHSCQM